MTCDSRKQFPFHRSLIFSASAGAPKKLWKGWSVKALKNHEFIWCFPNRFWLHSLSLKLLYLLKKQKFYPFEHHFPRCYQNCSYILPKCSSRILSWNYGSSLGRFWEQSSCRFNLRVAHSIEKTLKVWSNPVYKAQKKNGSKNFIIVLQQRLLSEHPKRNIIANQRNIFILMLEEKQVLTTLR